jgi:hypothetical protein
LRSLFFSTTPSYLLHNMGPTMLSAAPSITTGLSISFLLYSPVLPPNGDGDGGGSQGGRWREPTRISARASCARAAAAPGLPMEADPGEAAGETLGESRRGPAATARRRPRPPHGGGSRRGQAAPTVRLPQRHLTHAGTPCPGRGVARIQS